MKSSEIFANVVVEKYFENHVNSIDLISIRNELISMYGRCEKYLDKKYINEIQTCELNKINSCLWEIILLDNLKAYPDVCVEPHSNSGPDWKIKVEDKIYYVEATVANIPEEAKRSEIHRLTMDMRNKKLSSSDNQLIDEAKSRISNSIVNKIKSHEKLLSNNKEAGYILAISYGSLPFFATCDLFRAVETILPVGGMNLNIDHAGNILNQSLSYQDEFNKPSTNVPIKTNIFTNEQYNWISAILFSKVEPCLLLECAEKLPNISWGNKKNDFVLVHNPLARCPLEKDIFSSRSEINLKNSQLHIQGKGIYSSF